MSAPRPRQPRLGGARAAVLSALAAATMVACGSGSNSTPTTSAATPATPAAASPAPTTAASAGVRTVDDAFGPTEIPADPQRVVADSVSTYAHLMSLGITPIAVALPIGISPDYIAEGAGDMTSVVAGDGWTIDLEQAMAMKPDLIVGVGADYNQENCDAYRKAIATYCFAEIADTGTDADIKATVNGLAVALGREQEASAAITAYEARVAELAGRVGAAGLGDTKVAIVRFDAGGFIGVRVGQTANTVLAALGFAAPEFQGANPDGYLELSLETLETLDAGDVLIVNTDDDVVVGDVVAMSSPLWQQLDVVKNGKVFVASAWNGGDLPQLQRILDDVESGVIAPAERS